MSEKYPQTPFCDNHPDDVAQALCNYHKKLLCLSCVVEKSSECLISDIRKISGEQDSALYEGLLIRQIAINKKRLIEEHEKKAEELKNALKKQITDFHEQVMTSLIKTKDDCLAKLENNADRIIARNKHSKTQLETFERVIAENVEKFSAQSSSDLSEIQSKLHEIKQILLTEVPDVESDFEGNFQADKCLKDMLSKSGLVLGSVYLISQKHYDQVENETDNITEYNINDVTDIEENKKYLNQKESEGVTFKTTATGKGRQAIEKTATADDFSKQPQDTVCKKKQKQEAFHKEKHRKDQKLQDSKENKKYEGFLHYFRRKKPDSEHQDNETETETNLSVVTGYNYSTLR